MLYEEQMFSYLYYCLCAQDSSNTEQSVKAAEQMAQPSREDNGGAELKEQLINLTHERDSYKKKLEEFQTHLEEAKVSINF